MHNRLWPTLLTPILISACATAPGPSPAPAPDALRPLMTAIGQRIDIANDVALSKWYSGKPVQDSNRERQVIINAESQAQAYSLTRDEVRQFMTAQMEANKVVQYARIAQWHKRGRVPQQPASTLTGTIRTRLDTLQPVLMEKYAAFVPYRTHSACVSWVQAEIKRQTADPVIVAAMQRATADLCIAASNP